MSHNISIIKQLFLLLVFFPFLAFCQNQDLSALSVDPLLSEGADSVIRHEEQLLDLSDKGKLKTSITRIVTVYNKAGLSDVKAYAGYDNNSKVLKHAYLLPMYHKFYFRNGIRNNSILKAVDACVKI